MERTYKQFIKQILSLPTVYILSGAMPVEGVIHKRVLVLFGCLCRLDEESVEKQLACRQIVI